MRHFKKTLNTTFTKDPSKLAGRRGKAFEALLESVHQWYRMSGRADIIKNPETWAIISKTDYSKRITNLRLGKGKPGTLAQTDNGYKLAREKSDIDFSGGGKDFSICFDAKDTCRNTFPLEQLKEHQINRLYQSSKCGTIAGFMIRFTDRPDGQPDLVFFAPINFIRQKQEILLKQFGRRAKPGTASISVDELREHGVEIETDVLTGYYDYLAPLLKRFK